MMAKTIPYGSSQCVYSTNWVLPKPILIIRLLYSKTLVKPYRPLAEPVLEPDRTHVKLSFQDPAVAALVPHVGVRPSNPSPTGKEGPKPQ